ncbi:MAG TPA: NADH-quinone oxidoreductase subunit E, partial [Candidatus Aminicenantes bacterium]|nr:NADH-quinone oxidoreductase subunit E [Candidatus Aminicenantes bacterium]
MKQTILDRFQALRERIVADDPREMPAGAIVIQVGSATCENAAGAREVEQEFRKHIAASGRGDIVVHQVGCTGRCSLEPIVGILRPGARAVKYQQVNRESVHRIFTEHVLKGQPVPDLLLEGHTGSASRYELLFCGGERCGSHDAHDFRALLQEGLDRRGIAPATVRILSANCFGLCSSEQAGTAGHFLVRPGNVVYRVASVADVEQIIDEHLLADRPVERLIIDEKPVSQHFFELYGDVAFFNRQSRIALRNSGIVDPTRLAEYIGAGGFDSLAQALAAGDPGAVIAEITASKLRGRGGGGFPTGQKWQMGHDQPGEEKYLICNADEGDPGAFMDRSMLEGDPFSVIEGMLI